MASTNLTRNATLTATLASAWLCGGMASISLLAIPAISESSSNSIIVKQFTKMYQIGRLTQPPATVLTSLLFLYAAWKSHGESKMASSWKVLVAAGASVLPILGFTYAILEPTSHALMDMMHYRDIERTDGQEERVLVRKWGSLNGVRAGMAGVATGLGVWVLVD